MLNLFKVNILTWDKFCEKQRPFQKNEYHFINATFPHKNALSEANVKANRMAITKWTYHKERSFASNYLIFFENFVFKNLL